ncbi:DUF2726 domain-containing protein [Ruegeria sp. WL0004]|uniref:DUF2726 domain-containing protein n=2 Tax=Ruegeria marisflavi TaxID=2984152 RepID=A0ABT2WVS3_9RHOB|nr:DUF2726 domain-containing protein [Ruegeria sp. WL0004]
MTTLILIAVVLAIVLIETLRRQRWKRWRGSRRFGVRFTPSPNARVSKPTAEKPPADKPRFEKPSMAEPENQVAAIAKVRFEKTRLLNKTEYRVLLLLERIVDGANSGHRVMAQTNMGELIRPVSSSGTARDRQDAFASINSKRLDFAIVDTFGMLAVAVEVQGSGHYHHKTFMRDAVKREALRRAGVELLEIQPSWTDEEIEARVSTLLGLPVQDSGRRRAGMR